LSKFNLEKTNDHEKWDGFVRQSAQGSIFHLYKFLELAVDHFELFWIKKGNDIRAGFVLILNESNHVVLDDLVIHNGLLFFNKSKSVTKSTSENFAITSALIDFLEKNYGTYKLALSPFLKDMRPFLWHNYHSTKKNDKIHLDLRYTSFLDISSLRNSIEFESELFTNLSSLRRRHIREARQKGFSTILSENVKLLVDSFEMMMAEKADPQPKSKINRLFRLINGLIKLGYGKLFKTLNRDGQIIYLTFFAWDNNRAYYLFGCSTGKESYRFQGTIAFWDFFVWLANNSDLNIVDLEGINSPQRGNFKLSFGGSIESYYEINK